MTLILIEPPPSEINQQLQSFCNASIELKDFFEGCEKYFESQENFFSKPEERENYDNVRGNFRSLSEGLLLIIDATEWNLEKKSLLDIIFDDIQRIGENVELSVSSLSVQMREIDLSKPLNEIYEILTIIKNLGVVVEKNKQKRRDDTETTREGAALAEELHKKLSPLQKKIRWDRVLYEARDLSMPLQDLSSEEGLELILPSRDRTPRSEEGVGLTEQAVFVEQDLELRVSQKINDFLAKFKFIKNRLLSLEEEIKKLQALLQESLYKPSLTSNLVQLFNTLLGKISDVQKLNDRLIFIFKTLDTQVLDNYKGRKFDLVVAHFERGMLLNGAEEYIVWKGENLTKYYSTQNEKSITTVPSFPAKNIVHQRDLGLDSNSGSLTELERKQGLEMLKGRKLVKHPEKVFALASVLVALEEKKACRTEELQIARQILSNEELPDLAEKIDTGKVFVENRDVDLWDNYQQSKDILLKRGELQKKLQIKEQELNNWRLGRRPPVPLDSQQSSPS